VCCGVLQCVAVFCSALQCHNRTPQGIMLQCDTVCCGVLQCVAVCCSAVQCHESTPRGSVLQCDIVCCGVLQFVAVCCSIIIQRHEAVCCSVIRCAAVCCSVLQCVAVCCSAVHCHKATPRGSGCSVTQCVVTCCIYSLLHVGCHFFNLKSQSIFNFSWSLLPRSVEKKPIRLRLESRIEQNSKCNIMYLTHTYLCL